MYSLESHIKLCFHSVCIEGLYHISAGFVFYGLPCIVKFFMACKEDKLSVKRVLPGPLDKVQSTSHRHLDITDSKAYLILFKKLLRCFYVVCFMNFFDMKFIPVNRIYYDIDRGKIIINYDSFHTLLCLFTLFGIHISTLLP